MNFFERAVHLEPIDDGFAGVVPEGWATGRGAFGGLVLGYLARAIDLGEARPERRMRVFTGDVLTAVLPGPIVVRTRTLRRGKYQSNVQATLEQDGQIMATGSAVLSGARPATMETFAPAPPDLGELPVLPFAPPAAHFAELYEYRSRCHRPFAEVGEPYIEGYLAEKGERATPLDAPAILALLDSWWPVVLQTFERMRPIATVAFTAELFADPASLPRDARFALRARAVAARDGFILELRELWCDGELVAANQQSFALLG
jgi:hypothetical protein